MLIQECLPVFQKRKHITLNVNSDLVEGVMLNDGLLPYPLGIREIP